MDANESNRQMSFQSARVLAFETRRAREMAELIRLNGGLPFLAPALQEVPLEDNTEALRFASDLYAGHFDAVIFLTGVGAQYLARIIASRKADSSAEPGLDPEQCFRQALRAISIVTRGPKPAAVMRAWQVPVTVAVPEPNTWRELLAAMQDLPALRIAVQEYGRANPGLLDGLRAQGRQVTRVPVYQWRLPADTAPLNQALDELLAGRFSVALFTTGVQIEHLMQFAESQGRQPQAVAALRRLYLASIGPTCSESLRGCGLEPAIEPSHPKMGLLVREAALGFASRRAATTTPGKME